MASASVATGPFTNWASSPFTSGGRAVTCDYGNGLYVIGGSDGAGTTLITSANGLTSSVVASPGITGSVQAVIYSSDLGQWVGAGSGTNSLNWAPQTATNWTGVTANNTFSTTGTGVAVITSFKRRSAVVRRENVGQFFIFIPFLEMAPPAIQPLLRSAVEEVQKRRRIV